MTHVDTALNDIDKLRALRARELSEVKTRMRNLTALPRYGLPSKTVIVLAYAQWEGFYNECVAVYLRCLQYVGKRVRDVSWPMLVGVLQADFQSLRDRNHSYDAMICFVKSLRDALAKDFVDFDPKVIASRSNLSYSKIRTNFEVLGIDHSCLQRWRLRIDKELVGWRHGVAHGNDPDLSGLDIEAHVSFTQTLLLLVADMFEGKIIQIGSS